MHANYQFIPNAFITDPMNALLRIAQLPSTVDSLYTLS